MIVPGSSLSGWGLRYKQTMSIFFSFIICVAATVIGSISGVGGGVIIKPVMDAVSGMSVSSISFLSGCTVLGMTTTSMLGNRNGQVKIEKCRGTLLAVGAAAGGVMGKELFERAVSAGGPGIHVAQQVLMVVLTVGVLIYTVYNGRIHTLKVENKAVCVLIGLVLGGVSAFLGIGGGPVNLAVLYYFFSMDSKTAALNSLYIILISQSASLLNTLMSGNVPEFQWSILITMVAGGILGGMIGRRVSKKMDNRGVDRLFRGLLVVIAGISFYNLWCLVQVT